jgi:hypothetical protein
MLLVLELEVVRRAVEGPDVVHPSSIYVVAARSALDPSCDPLRRLSPCLPVPSSRPR